MERPTYPHLLLLAAGLCVWTAAAPARAQATPPARVQATPPPAAARVHDHVAFVFAAPDGSRSPAQRAAEAGENLTRVVDDELPGELTVDVFGTQAWVRVGDREIFRLVPADATAARAAGLADYAPHVRAALGDFLRAERRRSRLQHGVLGASLVVFFAVLAWLLLRLVLKGIHLLEARLANDSPHLPEELRRMARGPWRSLALAGLATLRVCAGLAAAILFLLAALSLFEPTRPFRDRLAAGATEPFVLLLRRLASALPSLLLLLILAVALRGGWEAINQSFERAASNQPAGAGIARERVRSYRLFAHAGLVLGALLILPLVLGADSGLATAVGLVGLAAVALAFLPLGATVVLGACALITSSYRVGEWVRLRLPGGRELTAEVVAVDFVHLRLAPEGGSDVRVPHLMLLFTPIVHLPEARTLAVEVPVERKVLAPGAALEVLQAAARRVAAHHGIVTAPEISLLEVTADQSRFRVALPGAPQGLRNALLLALAEATSARAGRALEDASGRRET